LIILDTCILWTFTPESSSGDLLRAIRAIGAQRVGAPWMVTEELAAQQAIKYRKKREALVRAVDSLREETPWGLEVAIGECAEARVRDHWREKWSSVVEEIPTSAEDLREAAFREANCLPPCKEAKGGKTGFRDATIWLSAVTYAREHPDETVYFASNNTKDFGDGSNYPPLLRDDLAGLEDRFVHWTNLDQVVAHFTEPAPTDMGLVGEILGAPGVVKRLSAASLAGGHFAAPEGFQCRMALSRSESTVVSATDGIMTGALLDKVESAQMYRIGEQEWCTATATWQLAGYMTASPEAIHPTSLRLVPAGCEWTATVLFRPDLDDSRLTVLRADAPRPLSGEAFNELPLDLFERTEVEDFLLREILPYYPMATIDLPPHRRLST
jgi:hypothetical protein